MLLLDEPTNNLDPASREEILGALAHYEGAVVLVSHDEGAVEALNPERVLILPDGVEDIWGRDYADLISSPERVAGRGSPSRRPSAPVDRRARPRRRRRGRGDGATSRRVGGRGIRRRCVLGVFAAVRAARCG